MTREFKRWRRAWNELRPEYYKKCKCWVQHPPTFRRFWKRQLVRARRAFEKRKSYQVDTW